MSSQGLSSLLSSLGPLLASGGGKSLASGGMKGAVGAGAGSGGAGLGNLLSSISGSGSGGATNPQDFINLIQQNPELFNLLAEQGNKVFSQGKGAVKYLADRLIPNKNLKYQVQLEKLQREKQREREQLEQIQKIQMERQAMEMNRQAKQSGRMMSSPMSPMSSPMSPMSPMSTMSTMSPPMSPMSSMSPMSPMSPMGQRKMQKDAMIERKKRDCDRCATLKGKRQALGFKGEKLSPEEMMELQAVCRSCEEICRLLDSDPELKDLGLIAFCREYARFISQGL